MNALRRIAAVARGTARDLFAGHGGAIVLLALLAACFASTSTRAATDAELRAVLLRERAGAAAALALLAVMLAAAHAIADDRRARRLSQLLATPLHPFEYLAGKVAGVFVALALPLAAIDVALLSLPDAGVLRHPEQFAPRRSLAAARALRIRGDGRAELWRRGSGAVVAGGERLKWLFEAPPGSGPLELELPLRPLGGDPDEHDAPVAVALAVDGRVVFERRELSPLAQTTLRVPLAADSHEVVLSVLAPAVGVRLDPGACRLLGSRGPPLVGVLRAGLGVALLLLFGGALAASLAVVLPDVIALLLAALVALLGFLRPLLLDVAATVADDVNHAAAATRALARLLAGVVKVVPDLSALVAGDRLATASPAFVAGDGIVHVAPLAFALVALGAAALVLRRAERLLAGGAA